MRPILAHASVINTHLFERVGDALTQLGRRNGIAAVVGPPGTGKSFAARTQIEISGIDAALACAPPSATTRELLCSLLSASDPTLDHVGNERTLRARLAAALVDSSLLVVDDAHELDSHCMKLLRRLTVGPDATCPLLLLGDERLAEQLLAQPWTRNHRVDFVEAEPLDRADLVEILPNYHTLYRTADMRALLWIDRAFAFGRWSHWSLFTIHAVRLHRARAFTTLDRSSAALILSHVPQ